MTIGASRIVQASLTFAVVAWLLVLYGYTYSEFVLSKIPAKPLDIFTPGTFFFLNIILCGFWVSCLGFLLAGIAVIRGVRGGALFWVAVFANGVYCFPLGVLLLRQYFL